MLQLIQSKTFAITQLESLSSNDISDVVEAGNWLIKLHEIKEKAEKSWHFDICKSCDEAISKFEIKFYKN